MFRKLPREQEWVSWLDVFLWTLVIYVTIPFARAIQRLIEEAYGRDIFRSITFVIGFLAVALMVLYVIRVYGWRFWPRKMILFGIAAFFYYYARYQIATPEETLHFIEYGVLGLLLYRAFAHRIQDIMIYPAVVCMGGIIGLVDEVIQWITPKRFWDFKDVWINILGVLLVQLAIALGIRPKIIKLYVKPASICTAARVAMVLVLLLLLCVSNTLEWVDWYATRIPGLEFLRQNESVMVEYGYYHQNPEIGAFYSRLTLDQLRAEDESRGKEAGEILNAYKNRDRYGEFLSTYTPHIDPFLHEAKVHLFRRDHYAETLWKHKQNEEMLKHHGTVVFREHQILQTYFSNTLAHTDYRVNDAYVNRLAKYLDHDVDYISPVSQHLITRFSKQQVQITLLIIIFLLGLLERYGAWHKDLSYEDRKYFS